MEAVTTGCGCRWKLANWQLQTSRCYRSCGFYDNGGNTLAPMESSMGYIYIYAYIIKVKGLKNV